MKWLDKWNAFSYCSIFTLAASQAINQGSLINRHSSIPRQKMSCAEVHSTEVYRYCNITPPIFPCQLSKCQLSSSIVSTWQDGWRSRLWRFDNAPDVCLARADTHAQSVLPSADRGFGSRSRSGSGWLCQPLKKLVGGIATGKIITS